MRNCVIPRNGQYGRLDLAVDGGPSRIELSPCGDSALVRVHGNIDAALAPGLRDGLGWAVNQHAGVVIDLAAVPALDPTGLGVLVRAQNRADGLGVRLCYAAPSAVLAAALRAVTAGGSVPILDDCPAAFSWLRGKSESAAVSSRDLEG